MKLIKYFFLSLITVSLIGCSSDDSDNNDSNEPEIPAPGSNVYFPFTEGDNWTYNNKNQVNEEPETTSTETLTTESTTGNTSTYSSNATPEEQGLVTGILTNGELTVYQTHANYNGSFSINLSEFGLENINIPLTDLTLYDTTESSGQIIFTTSNTIEQDINLQGQQVPVAINYTLQNVQDDFYESYPAGGESYTDVISSRIELIVSAEASLGPITVPVLEEQTVLISTNFYANSIGLILSENSYNYDFEDLTDFGVPEIPTTHIEASQTLDTYTVN